MNTSTPAENMFDTQKSHTPGPTKIETQSQDRTVKGCRRPSRSDAVSALDWPGMGRTLPIEGPGSLARPIDLTSFPAWDLADDEVPNYPPQAGDSRQANLRPEATTTEGDSTMDDTSIPKGRGLFRVHQGNGQPVITNIRRLAGRDLDTGSRLIAVATVFLAVLGAGLLAVSFAAQRQYVLAARHESWPSIIEALSLDVAMLIFALLGLGLAKKGLPARTERAAVIICACGSAFMNYLAADVSSPRSVAAYVMPPLLLALAADRVIAVVRRWVLGPGASEGSAWRTAGLGLAVGLVVLVKIPLYILRIPLAPKETSKGLRQWVLNATPLPESPAPIEAPAEVTEIEAPKTIGEILTDQGVILPGPGETKKDVLLKLYREHANHGNRELASKTATELAWRAELQPGTARTYIYQELDRIEAAAVAS